MGKINENESMIEDFYFNYCNLNYCKIYLDYKNQLLEDVVNTMKADILMKVNLCVFQTLETKLAEKDKIINALIGLLIQNEIIKETDIEDYIASEKVIDKLCE